MNIDLVQWAAGLVEGEGCFYFDRNAPVLKVGMTDRDVLEKFGAIVKRSTNLSRKATEHTKAVFEVKLIGKHAVGWAMTLYSLMCSRRRERIRSVLEKWKATPKPGRPTSTTCHRGHEFTDETTGRQHGRRYCRICQRAATSRWHKAHRALLNEIRRGRRRSTITE